MKSTSSFAAATIDGEHYSAEEAARLGRATSIQLPALAVLKKVLVYVTRTRSGSKELLVFEHRDHPDAGLQVPAGSIDTGEAAVAAAGRELMEESGLRDLPLQGRIDVYEWVNPQTSRLHRRHVYHFIAASDLPDVWNHTVSGGEEDLGMVFCYRWISLADASAKLAGEQGRSIARLS